MSSVNWGLVKVLYDDICAKLTFKQYVKWTTTPSGISRGLNYADRFRTLGTVTANKRLLKLASAALYEIEGAKKLD